MVLERKEALSEFRQRKGREQDLPPPYCLQKIQVLSTKMILLSPPCAGFRPTTRMDIFGINPGLLILQTFQ
jgi:hypothetical protein